MLDAKTLRVSLCEDQVLSAFVHGFVLLRSVGCKMMYELPVFAGQNDFYGLGFEIEYSAEDLGVSCVFKSYWVLVEG